MFHYNFYLSNYWTTCYILQIKLFFHSATVSSQHIYAANIKVATIIADVIYMHFYEVNLMYI